MRLIVTADDVGLHAGMNAGAVRAHVDGIVTACSVVANGAAFGDAVDRLSECPRMSVGVHLTLVEESPVCSAQKISSLLADNGRFFRNFRSFSARYALGRIRIAEVELELRTQIEKLLAIGLQPAHLNGHQHLHVLPRIFDVVLSLADEYRIGYVRIPSDHVPAGTATGRAVSMKVLNVFGEHARRRGRDLRTATTFGIVGAGHLTYSRLLALLGGLNGDTAELVCHPGIGDAGIAEAYDWGYAWDQETETLCDPAVREELVNRGIVLITPEAV